MPEEQLAASLDFCGDIVTYTACVPKFQRTWSNFTIQAKDLWVKKLFNAVVQERKRHEMNLTLQELGENEYGPLVDPASGVVTERGGNKVARRFWNGNYDDPDGIKFANEKGGQDLSDCEYAYKHYMCYLNFPRCDDEGKSLVLCRSVCENYANACHISDDLNRCGPNQFLGAQEAEVPTLDEETKEFTKFKNGVYPGWPFRDYMERGFVTQNDGSIVLSEEPVIRCTPSIKGVGGSIVIHSVPIFLCFILQVALFFCH
eukprot:g2752.t1